MKEETCLEVKDNEFLRQFETEIEGKFVKLEYSRQPRKMFLSKLVIADNLRERGFDDRFLEAVFEQLLEENVRVVPSGSDAMKFFKAHKRKYKKLLPTGINI